MKSESTSTVPSRVDRFLEKMLSARKHQIYPQLHRQRHYKTRHLHLRSAAEW